MGECCQISTIALRTDGRRSFIGGSDARIRAKRLSSASREKRGEVEPEDLSSNLIVQLGRASEELNRSWHERNSGRQARCEFFDVLRQEIEHALDCIRAGHRPVK